ncbi:MAG: arsenite methyltransferase [Planctomycetes bacterium]|nr:arsenite methyltransferase [Planctomycetota bacterium]
MKETDQVRSNVAEAYAKAVTTPSSSCCRTEPVQKGVAVKLAGYDREELDALPAEAVVNSFGCGNPLALAEVSEGDVVLDLGSGAGIDILLAGKKVGPTGRAIGIDMTDDMIAKANENIAAAGLENTEVRKGIIEDMPVESASVDWVISNCVINLSPEKPKVFAEIARVLKPGGRMRVSDIVVEELPEWVRKNSKLYSSCIAGAISEADYVAGLQAAGLENTEVTERLVYDALQLKSFIDSELEEPGIEITDGVTADELTSQMVGKIWSATFIAAKPCCGTWNAVLGALEPGPSGSGPPVGDGSVA